MNLQAGFAQVDITPRGRCELNGFAARTQPAVGVGQPVQGRVLLFVSGRRKALVATCDLLGFTVEDSARIEKAMAAAAGVPAGSVLLSCTHTHAAPMSMPLGAVGRHRPDYVMQVEKKLAQAAGAARVDLAGVTGARFGDQPAKAFGYFRCVTEMAGRKRFPGRLSALRLERAGAAAIIMAHMGVHPYVLGPQYRSVHPDYPGETCALLETTLGVRAMMLPGCGADVAPVDGSRDSLEHLAAWSGRAAAAVGRALSSGKDLDLDPLAVASISPRVRYGFITPSKPPLPGGEVSKGQANARRWRRDLAAGRLPTSSRFPMRFLGLGPLLLIGMPAEIFHDTGAELAAALPGTHTLTIAHAGGNIGYLPRPFAYQHNTYEAGHAYEWYGTAGSVIEGTEAAVRATAAKAVKRLLG